MQLIKPRKTNGGYTLIELLVVLVIVAALAAIAWPRFILAIERSRAVATVATMRKLQEALDDQILIGLNERHLDYMGGNELGRQLLLTNIDCKLDHEPPADPRCYTDKFSYRVWCSELGCFISVIRGSWANDDYGLLLRKVLTDWNNYPIGVWDKECMAHSVLSYKICQNLGSSGWKLADERYKELIKNLNM